MLKRLLYIPYYLAKTPAGKLRANIRFVKQARKISAAHILGEMIFCSVRYNISFMDYFELRFFELPATERRTYVGSGAMYEFQLRMNPKKFRSVLSDKAEFLKKFNDLAGRTWVTLDTIRDNESKVDAILQNPTGKLVLKNAKGQAGQEVDICFTRDFDRHSLIRKMEEEKFDLLETYVSQNDELMRLSASGLNTIRIITQYHQGQVSVIAARLRISVNSKTDNLSTGNIAAHIDLEKGRIAGPGIYVDIAKPAVYQHPVTGVDLVGFELPFWKECLKLVKEAAVRIPENRSVGWDVAVTNQGPVLIEGNHNWHYFLWQMPEKKGYKETIKLFSGL